MDGAPVGRGPDAACPVRKLHQPGERTGPAVEQVQAADAEAPDGIHGPRWVIRSYDTARQLVRSGQSLKQAGFGALTFIKAAGPAAAPRPGSARPPAAVLRPPVLYLEGGEHRDRRRAAAPFFTPKAVEAYRGMIDDLSRTAVEPLAAGRPADVSRLSLALSVAVVARVVGLTSSVLPGMSRRIEATFTANLGDQGWGPVVVWRRLRTGAALVLFNVLDVLPAIRARRRRPGDDLITHLLDAGARPLEILTECVIYCAAGMATTREFVTVAAWHLLDDPGLLVRYRAGDHDERLAVLQEVLRLEPVIGHLYRQVTAPISLLVEGTSSVLDVGTVLDFDLRAINADAALVGAEPLVLRPGRPLSTRGAVASVLSFGDGNHRCPGGPLAMLETEIFLDHLLALDLVVERTPRVGWNDLTGGYDLRGLVLRLRGGVRS